MSRENFISRFANATKMVVTYRPSDCDVRIVIEYSDRVEHRFYVDEDVKHVTIEDITAETYVEHRESEGTVDDDTLNKVVDVFNEIMRDVPSTQDDLCITLYEAYLNIKETDFDFAVYLPDELKKTDYEDENGYESLYEAAHYYPEPYAPVPQWCELADRYKYFSFFGDERGVYIFFKTEDDAKAAWKYWSEKYYLDIDCDDFYEFLYYLESRA